MTSVKISADQAVEYLANWTLQGNQNKDMLGPIKYNFLVKGFNLSTIFLVMSAAATVLFSYSAACVFVLQGLFMRNVTDQELNRYTLLDVKKLNDYPHLERLQKEEVFANAMIPQTESVENQTRKIFVNLNLPIEKDFDSVVFSVFGHVLWRRQIALPS